MNLVSRIEEDSSSGESLIEQRLENNKSCSYNGRIINGNQIFPDEIFIKIFHESEPSTIFNLVQTSNFFYIYAHKIDFWKIVTCKLSSQWLDLETTIQKKINWKAVCLDTYVNVDKWKGISDSSVLFKFDFKIDNKIEQNRQKYDFFVIDLSSKTIDVKTVKKIIEINIDNSDYKIKECFLQNIQLFFGGNKELPDQLKICLLNIEDNNCQFQAVLNFVPNNRLSAENLPSHWIIEKQDSAQEDDVPACKCECLVQ